ncbi:MAG TPA: thioether cross-link-forming SCIFF peptide maturase [Clostridia bacterium]|nr:thioether cross-link-forming SCIFF peptide maturase [Clostridia bacterium]
MIHKYRLGGYSIVLDVNSGTVHVLDDVTYDLLDYAENALPGNLPQAAVAALSEKYGRESLEDSWKEIAQLHSQGLLFSPDVYDAYRNAGEHAPIKSMCLNISHDCNLRCKYCFASTGDFGSGRKLMPFEVGKAAIDFILEKSAGRHNLEIDFFGGEPLMNFDTVKKVVEYGREASRPVHKNIRFTITTNGLLLDDDKIDFINREMSNVVLSIDGRKEVNDKMRIRTDGTGSYDEILKNFKNLVEKRNHENYYVRGTFTRENLDFMADVLHLADLGFDQVSVEPVIAGEELPYSIGEAELPGIFEEYEKLSEEIIKRHRQGRKFNFFHFMIDLDHGPCAIKLLKGCGCGNEYVAVTPDGDIYPCHQFVGHDEFVMGNVLNHDGGMIDEKMKDQFSKANIFTKAGCSECWAKFFCSGGCNANNHEFNGSIFKPHSLSCKMEKKRLECAIMIKAALS